MEKKENWKKKTKINHRILVFFPTVYLNPLKVYTKFEDSGCNRSTEFCEKSFIGEKEKWTNKGNDESSMLILFYTIQQVIPNIRTIVQNPRRNSSLEIFYANSPMYYIGVRDGKKEKWKKMVKINLSILVFCPTIYLATLKEE